MGLDMKRVALAFAGGVAAVALAAGPAVAYPVLPPVQPPGTGTNAGGSGNIVPPGGSTTITFGTNVPFTPGSTVTVTSSCTNSAGVTFAGPSITVTADAAGIAAATLFFNNPTNQPATCIVRAQGPGNVPSGVVDAQFAVAIAAGTGGGGGGGGQGGGGSQGGSGTAGGGGSTGGLATTGGNNTLTIAAVGGGLLLAGVGAVAVARRRERGNA